jgi:hypothetical protein
VLNSFLSCSAHYFECVVTHVLSVLSLMLPIGLAPHFCVRDQVLKSVKTLFNISAQPQLLEVEGSGDVGIVKVELRYILCS